MSEIMKRWIAGNYGPKTIGVGRAGGPAYFLMRANHGGINELLEDADKVVRALNDADRLERAEGLLKEARNEIGADPECGPDPETWHGELAERIDAFLRED